MVYAQKFVVAAKVNGRILRENNNVVSIPFGSEYSLLLKNLESRRAVVKIDIDGQYIGNNLIINPNSSIELERFIDNNFHSGNKFKFIEKTQEISDYRGDRVDDGLVRVEVWYEQVITYQQPFYNYYGNMTFTSGTTGCNDVASSIRASNQVVSEPLNNLSSITTVSSNVQSNVGSNSIPVNDNGITVKGNESKQSFQYGYVGLLESNSTVIVLKLTGYKKDNSIKIIKPVTVKTKLICSTCGRTSKSHKKFCYNCGTFLE